MSDERPKRDPSASMAVVVDPDENAAEIAMERLQEQGFQTIRYPTVGSALRYIERQKPPFMPGAILIDILVNDLGPYEAVRMLSERYGPKGVPIIMTSKHGTREDVTESQIAGAIGCLKKPMGATDLAALLNEHALRAARLSAPR